MENVAELRRGLHPWIISAEGWNVDDWRKNLVGAPPFFIKDAVDISGKGQAERDKLLKKAISYRADNIDDYVRYEIKADLCTLTDPALEKLETAIRMNQEGGEPRGGNWFDWGCTYYDL